MALTTIRNAQPAQQKRSTQFSDDDLPRVNVPDEGYTRSSTTSSGFSRPSLSRRLFFGGNNTAVNAVSYAIAAATPGVILLSGTAFADTHGAPLTRDAAEDANRTIVFSESMIPASTVDPSTLPTLYFGMHGPAVEVLEKRLERMGYDPGKPGVYDNTLSRSVVRYQRDRGLGRDGVVGPATWEKILGENPVRPNRFGVGHSLTAPVANGTVVPAATWNPAERPILRHGSSGPDTLLLQERLATLGYDVGVPDGVYGKLLRSALVNYQKDNPELAIEGWVGHNVWHALAKAQPTRPVQPSHTPGGTPVMNRYVPFSEDARALFREAAEVAGLPTAWADSTGLHKIIDNESDGRVGRPNYTYGNAISNNMNRYHEVRTDLLLNIRRTSSTATGLGQLLIANVDAHYPSGRLGIGDPLEEAVGMLRYIEDRYGNPDRAWARYNTVHEGY